MNKNSFQPKTKAKTKPSLLPLIIVFFVPVLLYLQTVSFGFIHFDDNDIIVENARFLSKISNVPQAFMTDAFITKISPFYRPMQTVSYIIDAQFSTENHPWMFHLSNIVLLGCIACVLLLLLKRFLIPPRLAFWATLLFCVHPLFVSTVAWIPARGDLLLTFFALLSFLFLIEYLQKNKTSYLIMHLITFIIALFCKETAAILPLLFITYYLSTAISKRIESKQLFAVIMYGIAGLCWFWLRSKAIGNFSDYNSKFGFTTFLSNIPTMLESVSQFFLPFPIAPIPGFSLFKTMTGIVILGVIIFLLFKNWKGSYKVNSFCFIWFLLLMVPPMFYFQPNIEYLNHRFFLPLIGLLVFLLHIFPKKWLQNGDIKNSKILLVIVVCLGSLTFINSRSYSNPVTYYDAVILQNPHSAFAYNNRGLLKSLHADELGATQDYEKAIAINSDYFDAYYNNGCAKAKLGDNPGAIENYNKAIALNQKSAGAFNNRGVAKANIGKRLTIKPVAIIFVLIFIILLMSIL